MIKCRRCKQRFGSIAAYGIHTWMVEKVGRRKICPTSEQLKRGSMSLWNGQWFFLSDDFLAQQESEHEQ